MASSAILSALSGGPRIAEKNRARAQEQRTATGFQQGQADRESAAASRVLQGNLLAGQFVEGSQQAELAQSAPDVALRTFEALNIPASAPQLRQRFAEVLQQANAFQQSGNDDAAREAITGFAGLMQQSGVDTSALGSMLQAAQNNPNLIPGLVKSFEDTGLIQGIDPQKAATLAKTQAETKKLLGGAGRTEGDTQKQINTLRKDITAASKDFAQVEAARNRIVKSGEKATAASDISLIFNFMKMNDPGSTVREGEFATAQNAAGVSGRILSTYNNLLEGTRLNSAQRADFIDQSESLFDAQRESFDSSISRTLDFADQDQIPRGRVLGRKRLEAFNARASEREAASKVFNFDAQGNPI